ncbi:MAG: glycosyltransferase, partial [Candidatus Desulfofervidus auxilii]|nr:glycosyltransferase [Candidatus Desulfofervidus auxilii]
RNVRLRLINFMQTNKPHILVIDPFLPVFDRASGSNRLLQMLKILRNSGFIITFISTEEMSEVNKYKKILEDMNIETFLGQHLLQTDSSQFFKFRNFKFAIISFYYMAEKFLPIIRKFSPHTKVIVDSVDIHFLREKREAEVYNDPDLLKKAMITKTKEIEVYSQADAIIAITEDDKKVLLEHAKGKITSDKVFVIPNIHNINPTELPFEKRKDLLFVGNFNHLPNVDAMKYFCQEIFPKIKEKLKDIKLYIVGNNPPQEIKDLENKNIIVTGYVPDLKPYMESTKVFIAPLRYGAGMKGKIGEALSYGLPVVTTSIGTEGMNLKNNTHVIIADDASTFANAVIKLYTDKELWERLRENGIRHIQNNFTPEVIDSKLKEMFEIIEKKEIARFPLDSKISIIVINYKKTKDTLECLSSINKNDYEKYQVIVVNNTIRDGLKELQEFAEKEKINFIYCEGNHFIYPKKSFKRELILINNKENLGFAGGNNIGIKYALNCGADYIWLLNNDTIIDKDALVELVKLAETDKKIGLISSKIYCYNNPKKVQYDGKKTVYEGMDDIKNDFPKPTNFASGCSLFIRREFIEKVGFLDEDYFLYFEDNDISARALKAGWKVYYNPYSKVYHKGGVSIGGWLKSPLSVYYATRNLLLYHYKHNFFDVSRDFDYLKNQVFSQLDGDKIRVYAFVQGIEDFIYGKKGKAEIDFEKIVEIIEEIEKEKKEIENILKEFFEKDLKEKFSLIKKALILNPSQTDLIDKFLNLAQALFFKESLKRSNDNLLNYCQEAEKLYSDGQVEEAIKLFKKVLELDPNFALAHNDLAFIYWQNKDTKKALYHLTKAITLAPEDRDIIWNCGQIMFSLGYIKDAYEVYKNYLQKHPDEVEIRQVVEELEKIIVNNDFKKISFTS